jgi:2-C-methyl-D-erythritol 4-phosphate cytidylyltransferase
MYIIYMIRTFSESKIWDDYYILLYFIQRYKIYNFLLIFLILVCIIYYLCLCLCLVSCGLCLVSCVLCLSRHFNFFFVFPGHLLCYWLCCVVLFYFFLGIEIIELIYIYIQNIKSSSQQSDHPRHNLVSSFATNNYYLLLLFELTMHFFRLIAALLTYASARSFLMMPKTATSSTSSTSSLEAAKKYSLSKTKRPELKSNAKPAETAFQAVKPRTLSEVAVVLLAGGKGKRMKSAIPKQFLPVLGRPVFLRSLDVFAGLSYISNIVIVLDESYRDEYAAVVQGDSRIVWADPGAERQDSVFNGLQKVPDSCSLVAIHDSARPLVTRKEVESVLFDALEHGAAVLGVPMKATVKESEDGKFVLRTVPRSRLWEVHTPQVVTKALLLEGFAKVKSNNLEVTDDVSVVEALGKPVKLTLGEYTNIKLTTPDDLQIAEQILRERGVVDPKVASNKSKVGTSSAILQHEDPPAPETPKKKFIGF